MSMLAWADTYLAASRAQIISACGVCRQSAEETMRKWWTGEDISRLVRDIAISSDVWRSFEVASSPTPFYDG